MPQPFRPSTKPHMVGSMSTKLETRWPCRQICDTFDHGFRDLVLDWTLANEGRFEPARVTDRYNAQTGGAVDTTRRNALVTWDFGDIVEPITAAFRSKLEEIASEFGYRDVSEELELEISAYGDGAHFYPHLDIPTGSIEANAEGLEHQGRTLSLVYYFHRRPKGFAGGELSFVLPEAFPGGRNEVEFEPIDNSLAAFPSWLVHQVKPVSCPSGRFEDYRFAINCWLYRGESRSGPSGAGR